MQGERSSVFKGIFLNPLVWIGLFLTLFTLEYDEDDVFGVFFAPETYRNLAIGSALYVGIFGRKYTDGMCRIDWNQTLGAVMETMLTVLIVWFMLLFAIIYYQNGGEAYSQLLRQRYKNNGFYTQTVAPVKQVIENGSEEVELQSGQKIKVTPNDDGSFTVEVK